MHSQIFIIVLPVFLVIALGFGLRRTRLVNDVFLFDLNRLIYYIALPALLFYKIATADFLSSFNGRLLAGLVVTVLLIFLVAYAYGGIRGYRASVHGSFCQASFRGNLAYIGLAIIYNAYGEEGFTVAGILLGFLVPLFNFLSVLALLFPRRREGLGMKSSFFVKQVACNPLILASLSGIVWSFLALPLPMIVNRAFNIVTGMSLPLALISIGASFSFDRLRGDLATASIAVFLKTVIMPALAAVILFFFGIRGQDLAIGVLLAGTPTATAAYIMAQQMKGNAELSGTIVMLSTLCSLATYTLALYMLQYMKV